MIQQHTTISITTILEESLQQIEQLGKPHNAFQAQELAELRSVVLQTYLEEQQRLGRVERLAHRVLVG